MQTVSRQAHVTLSGDIAGEYVVVERGEGGELTLAPDLSVKAILARHGERPMSAENFERHFGDLPTDDDTGIVAIRKRLGTRAPTPEESEDFWREYGPLMLPPDGEG